LSFVIFEQIFLKKNRLLLAISTILFDFVFSHFSLLENSRDSECMLWKMEFWNFY